MGAGRQAKAKPTGRITLTRIAPRPIDKHDNLPIGFKAVVDEVAAWLGVPDNHPGITWLYANRKGKPKQYAVEITIEVDHAA